MSDIYWNELLYGLRHGPHRRMHLRQYACKLGMHWPVSWWDVHLGSDDPPTPNEPDWACETCAKVRLPYRSIFWRLSSLFHGHGWSV